MSSTLCSVVVRLRIISNSPKTNSSLYIIALFLEVGRRVSGRKQTRVQVNDDIVRLALGLQRMHVTKRIIIVARLGECLIMATYRNNYLNASSGGVPAK